MSSFSFRFLQNLEFRWQRLENKGIQSQNYVDLIFCTREYLLNRPLASFNKHDIQGQNYVRFWTRECPVYRTNGCVLDFYRCTVHRLYLFCSSLPSVHDIEKLNQWNEVDSQIERPLQIRLCYLSVATLLVRCCRNNDNGFSVFFSVGNGFIVALKCHIDICDVAARSLT